jgi:hypothetical protein
MPTKKNRGTEGRNDHVPTLREAMGLSAGPAVHAADVAHGVTKQLKAQGANKNAKHMSVKGAHDVSTRMNLHGKKK